MTVKRIVSILALVLALGGAYIILTFFVPLRREIGKIPDQEPVRERQAIPVPKVGFTDMTDAAGITFRHTNGAAGQKLLPETMGSGVAIFDYDRDGLNDILFVNSSEWPNGAPRQGSGVALYRNLGDFRFADVTAEVGLNVPMYGLGVAFADIDNDGWHDLFITAIGGNHLWLNEAAGEKQRRFRDITTAAGVGGKGEWPNVTRAEFLQIKEPIPFPSSATFFDYDLDGKLDLFVCHYITWSPTLDQAIDAKLVGVGRAYVPPTQFEGAQCTLYRNIDGKRFEDVSEAAGILVHRREGTDANARQRNVGKSLGVVVCDPDGDGRPDIVVANDTVQNFFFHNIDGNKFEEIGNRIGVAYAEGTPRGAMGIDWGEFQPNRHAILIANFANEPCTFLCLDNPKRLLFSDGLSVGLAGPSRSPLKFGSLFFDYDLDGRLDLVTANGHLEPEITKVQQSQSYEQAASLYWNNGRSRRTFEPVTVAAAGPDLFRPIVGRGVAYADLDNDGDLDLVLTSNNGKPLVLRNDGSNAHWVRLRLEGTGAKTPRDAISAIVTLTAGGKTQQRVLMGARGYLSQPEIELTFGLGDATTIDEVKVQWPGSDTPTTQANLAIDQLHVLRQP